MAKYTCRHCGDTYEYCRGCHLSPILYKSSGFCSQKCADEFKNKQKEVIQTEDVEVVKTDRDISTSK